VKDQRLRVARLIEDDYAEPGGRARRFFEDQKSLMPKGQTAAEDPYPFLVS
jgi:hypothetical protein